ncbi:MAG TPA: tetratricopeptide repeat protein [Terriglobales bacterium]|nr:tetratricopeptide repeat protein [Terriglobales bacterium]
MKYLRCGGSFLVLLVAIPLIAQGRGSRSSGSTPGINPTPLPGMNPSASLPITAFISGKVTLDDGSPLTDPAAIQLSCHGQRHTTGYTDTRGNFNFQFADRTAGAAADASDAGVRAIASGVADERSWRDCELQAVLAGYSSQVIELASRMSTLESVDLGTITLHRLEHVKGTSISITSLMAPKSAKQALEKAREEERKGKWDQARKSLEKAVDIYPKYAVAWSELGGVQMRQNDRASAKKSFEQSVTADPQYVNAYDGLAQLAYRDNQWPQVVEITNKLLALNPVNFPGAYFLNGAGNYYLGNLDAAERNARQGIRVDDTHQVPKLQFLLAMILTRKGEYQEAAEQIRQYLNVAKEPGEIQEAQKLEAEIDRLAAKPGLAGVQERK